MRSGRAGGADSGETAIAGSGAAARPSWAIAALAILLVVQAGAIAAAARRTSLTFDEITFIAGGARGFATGRFDLVPDHPLLVQYVYGLPAYLRGLAYPAEPVIGEEGAGFHRYPYARALFWGAGNDFEAMARTARLAALACALLLTVLVYRYARERWGPGCGLLAAALCAFLPDVLAHGGVAYSDLPGALLYFAAVWSAEAAARRPGAAAGARTGLLIALALGVKFSAVLLLPVAVLLLLWGGRGRGRDPRWRRGALAAAGSLVAALYLVSLAICRGDVALAPLRLGLALTFGHVGAGHVAPGYLLGRTSQEGWWYFYPVAFLLKTPVALHALLLLACAAALRARREGARDLAPFRGAVAGGGMFVSALLPSHLAIGFRHALPVLPFVCVLAAAGAAALWRRGGAAARALVAGLALWAVVSPLSWHPHYLAFTSEYVRSRDDGHRFLLDSSLDWGQGLRDLSAYLEREGVPAVYLSYFGSALPEGYGISYVPLPSFLPLPAQAPEAAPTRVVISATNLHGLYLGGDPFAPLRGSRPEAVVAHTLFVYPVPPGFDAGAGTR